MQLLWCAVTGTIKLALQAGKANPSPPVGPALGAKVSVGRVLHHSNACMSHAWLSRLWLQGVNIMAFCKDYNAATQDKIGTIIPVEITVFEVLPAAAAPPDHLISGCHSLHQEILGSIYQKVATAPHDSPRQPGPNVVVPAS